MKRVRIKERIVLVFLAGILLLVSPISAQTWSWETFWGSEGFEVAHDISLDTFGNVYLTGVKGSGPFGGYDAFLVSFDRSGVLRFEAFWGTRGYENAYGVALDVLGNLYITGITSPGPFGEFDVFVASFNSSGGFRWIALWGTPGYEWATAVAIDNSGNIYVAGYTSEFYFQGSPTDAFLVSFDGSGAFRWETFWGTSKGYERADAVAVDSLGNVYIGGRSGQGEIYGQPFDAFVVSYDPSGNLKWETIRSIRIACDFVLDIALDSSGNVYIAGVVLIFGPFGNGDAFLVSFDGSGAFRWETFWGTPGKEVATGVTLDPVGNIYIAGFTSPGPYGGDDAFLVSFNPSGGFNWKTIWGTAAMDQAWGLVLDCEGNARIAGFTYPGPYGSHDVFIAAFSIPPIAAQVNIDPETLNLASNSKWITGYIEFPQGYAIEDINTNTISINNTVSTDLTAPSQIGDHDMNGLPDLMVKFNRAAVLAWLCATDYRVYGGESYNGTFKVSGEIRGMSFEGFDTIRILGDGGA